MSEDFDKYYTFTSHECTKYREISNVTEALVDESKKEITLREFLGSKPETNFNLRANLEVSINEGDFMKIIEGTVTVYKNMIIFEPK